MSDIYLKEVRCDQDGPGGGRYWATVVLPLPIPPPAGVPRLPYDRADSEKDIQITAEEARRLTPCVGQPVDVVMEDGDRRMVIKPKLGSASHQAYFEEMREALRVEAAAISERFQFQPIPKGTTMPDQPRVRVQTRVVIDCDAMCGDSHKIALEREGDLVKAFWDATEEDSDNVTLRLADLKAAVEALETI